MIQNYGDEMLKIKNNRLYITQGDTLNLKVNLRNNDGSIYEMNDTDTLTYVIRKDDIKLLLQKNIFSKHHQGNQIQFGLYGGKEGT